ncbi:HpcH/HpaI aldolase family protein [Roseomonas sp. BN140053]|uniref:HpcH/HpaI aldolase family protein n=1 Tax=Roseomonas sp. BN140053 TaxID=3391898 RepID=UPI0039E8B9B9
MLDLTSSRLRARLRSGEGFGVFWLSLGSLPVVEFAVNAGAAAIVLDGQHGLWERNGLEAAIAAAGNHCPVIVRVAENGATVIGQALDAGAEGVLVPLVESGAEAAAAVSHAHFPPHGTRSGGGVRPLSGNFGAYLGAARDRTAVGVMIETRAGLERRAEIVATPGLDFLLIGTGDLSISLGVAGPADPRVEKACAAILASCRAASLPCGIFTGNAEAGRARLAAGYAMSVLANDIDVLATGFRRAAEPG